mmetsp:Transcript_36195/g.58103  ORF Transcript_36195/g.58103 Transcript_36195/m.58103 type:complete len:161 (+) Transcript_36195:90-572(+)|eukprot:jgi/Bigna1/88424/estExt_fgenesh1_pg.C_310185
MDRSVGRRRSLQYSSDRFITERGDWLMKNGSASNHRHWLGRPDAVPSKHDLLLQKCLLDPRFNLKNATTGNNDVSNLVSIREIRGSKRQKNISVFSQYLPSSKKKSQRHLRGVLSSSRPRRRNKLKLQEFSKERDDWLPRRQLDYGKTPRVPKAKLSAPR